MDISNMVPGLRRGSESLRSLRSLKLSAGFTLIEIAIVLTVIGLIVASVVVGQSVIRSSQLQSIVNDVDRYKKAVQLFKEKYTYLPGDMPTASSFWAGAANGNGDGFIGDSTGTALLTSTGANVEGFGMWQHLADAGFIEGSYTGAFSGTVTQESAGVNTPTSKVPGNTFLLFYVQPVTPASIPAGVFSATYRHVIVYGTHSTTVNGTSPIPPYNPGLTAAEAQAIDQKLDDGMPGTGNVLTYTNAAGALGGATLSCASGATTAATYQVNVAGTLCSLIFITGF